jgi:DNA repair exonuclease SbcCD ATPase subunit
MQEAQRELKALKNRPVRVDGIDNERLEMIEKHLRNLEGKLDLILSNYMPMVERLRDSVQWFLERTAKLADNHKEGIEADKELIRQVEKLTGALQERIRK